MRVVGPATEEVTLGDVLINALGLTGAITVTAMVLGIVLGPVVLAITMALVDVFRAVDRSAKA